MSSLLRQHRFVRLWLWLFAALLPAVSSGIQPLRVVGTGGRIGNTFYTPAAGNTSFRQRTPHKLGGPVSEIRIGFMDWMYPYDAETPNDTNNVTIEHAWLERASTGQVVPLAFSGSRQLVLPMNSTTAYWLSDAIPSSVWTGATPARDEVFWLHVHGTVPEGGKLPVGTPSTYSGAKFIAYSPANDPGTFDTGGPVPTIAGSAARTLGLPLVFLGRFTGPGHLSVIGIGDSILDGTGDPANPVPVISGYGFFNRAAVDSNGANTIAMFNVTRHGQAASNFVNLSRQKRQSKFLPFANVVVEEYGTNDLGSAGGGSPATILGNLNTIWSTARAAGVQKIVRTLLLPRTASSDSWATLANQTPNTGWEAGGKRDTINAGLQTALANGKIDVLLDTPSILADPTDRSRWLTNGTIKYMNVDEAHVSPAGNALLAPHLRAALVALKVDDYAAWSAGKTWGTADPSPAADPNSDGINNLLAYALDLPPTGSVPTGNLPHGEIDSITPDGPWMTFTYRENSAAADLGYSIQTSSDLAEWTTLTINGSTAISEVVNADPDGDGSCVLRRVRVLAPVSDPPRFLRLRVNR
ncbi:MAG: SGNH/GDSL hydrolase family protein [Luteolibacter sp.]